MGMWFSPIEPYDSLLIIDVRPPRRDAPGLWVLAGLDENRRVEVLDDVVQVWPIPGARATFSFAVS